MWTYSICAGFDISMKKQSGMFIMIIWLEFDVFRIFGLVKFDLGGYLTMCCVVYIPFRGMRLQ